MQVNNGIPADRLVSWPMTRSMCAPMSDGSGALVLCAQSALSRFDAARAVRVLGIGVSSSSNRKPEDYRQHLTRAAASRCYEMAGYGPQDVSVAEIHDASAPAELMVYEQLGLAEPGGGPELIASGRTRLDGDLPVNTSGGLLSKGHPIGATGLAQICEATWQLRGEAGGRQVAGARVALTQNGGGWLEGDSAAMSVHVLTAD